MWYRGTGTEGLAFHCAPWRRQSSFGQHVTLPVSYFQNGVSAPTLDSCSLFSTQQHLHYVVRSQLNYESYYVPLCLKPPNSFIICEMWKTEVPIMVYKELMAWLVYSLISWPTSLLDTHSLPATMDSLLLHWYTRHTTASGPSYLLFSLCFNTLHPGIYMANSLLF